MTAMPRMPSSGSVNADSGDSAPATTTGSTSKRPLSEVITLGGGEGSHGNALNAWASANAQASASSVAQDSDKAQGECSHAHTHAAPLTGRYGPAEALERWYEDLQHYESTLEEMAAAALDQNFQDELNAIEQWFAVLSDAERTAAMYQLLQGATNVQIRFFITVLQQMLRADPLHAILQSPTAGNNAFEAQMDAKLASMGLRSPSTASPVMRQFARQSLESTRHQRGFSANGIPSAAAAVSAATQEQSGFLSPVVPTAPKSHLTAESPASSQSSPGRRNVTVDPIGSQPRTPTSPIPPIGSGAPSSPAPGTSPSGGHSPRSLAPPTSNSGLTPAGELLSQLSPIAQGSWASMTNTPVVSMFGPSGNVADAAANKLGTWQQSQQRAPLANRGGIVLDDVRKYRRKAPASLYPAASAPPHSAEPQSPAQAFAMAQQQGLAIGLAGLQQQQQLAARAAAAVSSAALTSPGITATAETTQQQQTTQQAAVTAQQNWRAGRPSPSTQQSPYFGATTPDAQYAASSNLPGGPATAPANAATTPSTAQLQQLFAIQQQIIQQQNAQIATLGANLGAGGGGGGVSPGLSPAAVAGFFPGGSSMRGGSFGQRRVSPRSERSPGGPRSAVSPGAPTFTHAAGAPHGTGANPDEEVDDALLADIPAWLRSLRLHKYTDNFSDVHKWQDLVAMDEQALEQKGVAALGARRELLK